MTIQQKREALKKAKFEYVKGFGWYFGEEPWKGPNGYGSESYFAGRNASDAYETLMENQEREAHQQS